MDAKQPLGKPVYEIGDTVFRIETVQEQKPERMPCPDCLGEKFWNVTLPSGEEFPVECGTCKVGFNGPYGTVPGGIVYNAYVHEEVVHRAEWEVRNGIVQFRYNYRSVDDTFPTREDAQAACDRDVQKRLDYANKLAEDNRRRKLREVNRPHGRIDREDIRDALQGVPYDLAQSIYHELTGGRLPRRKK